MQLEPYLGSFPCISLLSDGRSPRLVKKTEVELAIKPLHSTSIHLLSSHFWLIVLADLHIFPTYADVPSRNFIHKGPSTQKRKLFFFFALTNPMSISGRFVVNANSVGNMKFCFKSVATCQSMQPSSIDSLRIFSRAIFEVYPSLTNWIAPLLIIFRALLAVSQHVFETSEKIYRTSLCLQV